MKRLLSTLVFLFGIQSVFFAQDTVKLIKANLNVSSVRYKVKTNITPQALFANIGGSALLISVNYDRRFEKRTDGLGFKVGVNITPYGSSGVDIYALGINHLFGNNKNGKFLETGINYTFVSSKNNKPYSFPSLNLGYRSQPVNGGRFFAVGLSPMLIKNNFFPLPYISGGFNF
jgi:hypothetical protein